MENGDQKKYFSWGFLFIGFISFTVGAVIFSQVAPSRDDPNAPPKDIVLVSTQVYSNQGLMFRELNQYTPDFARAGLDQETCNRYRCLLRVSPKGKNFELRLQKDDKIWFIRANSPVPKITVAEVGPLEENISNDFR